MNKVKNIIAKIILLILIIFTISLVGYKIYNIVNAEESIKSFMHYYGDWVENQNPEREGDWYEQRLNDSRLNTRYRS